MEVFLLWGHPENEETQCGKSALCGQTVPWSHPYFSQCGQSPPLVLAGYIGVFFFLVSHPSDGETPCGQLAPLWTDSDYYEVHPRRGYCYAILSWALDVSSVLRFVLWAGALKFFLNSMCDHSSMAEHHTGAMKPLTVDPLVSTGDFSVDMLSEGEGRSGPVNLHNSAEVEGQTGPVKPGEEKAEGKSCLVRPWEETKVEGHPGPVKPGTSSKGEGQQGPVTPESDSAGEKAPVGDMSRLSLNEGKGARSPRIDRDMPRIFSKHYSWNDIGPVMDADSVVVGYVVGLEPNKGPVFFSKRPTIGTRMVDSNIVDKFGLPVWVEDGAQFSSGVLRRFVGVQERGHCPEWLANAPTILPQMNDVSKTDILLQDLDSSMEGCEVSDDEILGSQDL